jgi:four helix bundle protein
MEKAHKKLRAWQEAMSLTQNIYEVTKDFPTEEKYGIVNQMRRAAVSIPSNIAEGAARNGTKDSIHFYIIARASLSELDTQVELCQNLGFLQPAKAASVIESIETVDALLNGLIRFNKNKGLK